MPSIWSKTDRMVNQKTLTLNDNSTCNSQFWYQSWSESSSYSTDMVYEFVYKNYDSDTAYCTTNPRSVFINPEYRVKQYVKNDLLKNTYVIYADDKDPENAGREACFVGQDNVIYGYNDLESNPTVKTLVQPNPDKFKGAKGCAIDISDGKYVAIYKNSDGYLCFEPAIIDRSTYPYTTSWTSTTSIVSKYRLGLNELGFLGYDEVIVGLPIVDMSRKISNIGNYNNEGVHPIYVMTHNRGTDEVRIVQCVINAEKGRIDDNLTKVVFTMHNPLFVYCEDYQLTYMSCRDNYNNIKGCVFNAIIAGKLQWFRAVTKSDTLKANEPLEQIGNKDYVVGITSQTYYGAPTITGGNRQPNYSSGGFISIFQLTNKLVGFQFPIGFTTAEYYITSKYFANEDMIWVHCKTGSKVTLRPHSEIYVMLLRNYTNYYLNTSNYMFHNTMYIYPLTVDLDYKSYVPYVEYVFPYQLAESENEIDNGYILCCNKNDLYSIEG